MECLRQQGGCKKFLLTIAGTTGAGCWLPCRDPKQDRCGLQPTYLHSPKTVDVVVVVRKPGIVKGLHEVAAAIVSHSSNLYMFMCLITYLHICIYTYTHKYIRTRLWSYSLQRCRITAPTVAAVCRKVCPQHSALQRPTFKVSGFV